VGGGFPVASQPAAGEAEVTASVCLAGAVGALLGEIQRDLVGPPEVLPVPAPVQARGEGAGELPC
jgi:hypothetical protein